MSTHTPTKKEKIQGLFYAGIVGDALCLGSHYEYDAKKIYKAYGDKNIEKFMSPGEMMGGQTHGIGWGERNYHPGKTAGGTTDYGDYNILVLEHLASLAKKNEVFTLESLIPHWMDRFENSWGSWICTMKKKHTHKLNKMYHLLKLVVTQMRWRFVILLVMHVLMMKILSLILQERLCLLIKMQKL